MTPDNGCVRVTGCSREEARLSLARNRGSARKAVEEWEAAHGK